MEEADGQIGVTRQKESAKKKEEEEEEEKVAGVEMKIARNKEFETK